MFT
ncbi:hypothetical protein YPPY34_4192, partial [Yersinia pestis PY-34]|jgi:hypothetical protein